jgi:hypothetical protein
MQGPGAAQLSPNIGMQDDGQEKAKEKSKEKSTTRIGRALLQDPIKTQINPSDQTA